MFRRILLTALMCLPASGQLARACSVGIPPQTSALPPLTGHLVSQTTDHLYLTTFTTTPAGTSSTSVPLQFFTSANQTTPVALSNPFNASFSPDGKWIVFSAVAPMSDSRRIYLSTVSGTHLVDLTSAAGQDTTNQEEDARFEPDGSAIIFKQFDYIGANKVSAFRIRSMKITWPATADQDPAPGQIYDLLPDTQDKPGHYIEYSTPVMSPSEKYLYYATGSGGSEAIHRITMQSPVEIGNIRYDFLFRSGFEHYYPIVRDFTTMLFVGWINKVSKVDQIYMYAPIVTNHYILLRLNDCNYSNSDPTPVDEDYIIFSSNRIRDDKRGCTYDSGQGSYKCNSNLYLGKISTGEYWILGSANSIVNGNNINSLMPDILGPSYTLH